MFRSGRSKADLSSIAASPLGAHAMPRSLAFTLALVALMPAAAFAQTPSRAAIRNACAADFQKHCPGIKPGGGRLAACFKDKQASFSADCLATLQIARSQRRSN
jgi:hypothetical protein